MKINQHEVDRLIDILATKILASGRKFKWIVGIKNGGLKISVPLAKKLDLPHHAIWISWYDGHNRRRIPIVNGFLVEATGNLIVDNLIDGGATIHTFDQYFKLKGNAVAVLYWNVLSYIVPDYYASEKPNDWIQWPWELDNEN